MLQLEEEEKQPVPKDFLDALPLSEFTEANKQNFSEENKMCAICQCNYEVGEKFIIVPCLHRFHKDCVTQWFEQKNTCPVCKAEVCEAEEPGERRPDLVFSNMSELNDYLLEMIPQGRDGYIEEQRDGLMRRRVIRHPVSSAQ